MWHVIPQIEKNGVGENQTEEIVDVKAIKFYCRKDENKKAFVKLGYPCFQALIGSQHIKQHNPVDDLEYWEQFEGETVSLPIKITYTEKRKKDHTQQLITVKRRKVVWYDEQKVSNRCVTKVTQRVPLNEPKEEIWDTVSIYVQSAKSPQNWERAYQKIAAEFGEEIAQIVVVGFMTRANEFSKKAA